MRRVIWAAIAVLVLTGFWTQQGARAAPTAGTKGDPWVVPPLEAAVPDALGWETIPLEGATCGRGAPFAYFLNPAPDPEAGLFIWLMGGGACLKDGPPPAGATGIARQLHCMTYTNFAGPTDAMHLWTAVFPYFRRVAANPYGDYHWVFVPYCTGDIHAGQMTDAYDYDPSPDSSFDVVHRGHLNVVAVLDDVARRYPADRHVVLTGSSAGGFGAIFNFPDAIGRWPSAVLVARCRHCAANGGLPDGAGGGAGGGPVGRGQDSARVLLHPGLPGGHHASFGCPRRPLQRRRGQNGAPLATCKASRTACCQTTWRSPDAATRWG